MLIQFKSSSSSKPCGCCESDCSKNGCSTNGDQCKAANIFGSITCCCFIGFSGRTCSFGSYSKYKLEYNYMRN